MDADFHFSDIDWIKQLPNVFPCIVAGRLKADNQPEVWNQTLVLTSLTHAGERVWSNLYRCLSQLMSRNFLDQQSIFKWEYTEQLANCARLDCYECLTRHFSPSLASQTLCSPFAHQEGEEKGLVSTTVDAGSAVRHGGNVWWCKNSWIQTPTVGEFSPTMTTWWCSNIRKSWSTVVHGSSTRPFLTP